MSVETLKDKGVPISLCDLISNMLDVADAKLGGEDVYRCMSDVRDDLQLMLLINLRSISTIRTCEDHRPLD